ncbi:MAG: hypothetical protein ACOYK8_00490 [Alphaproteobacteria bacterium]
MHPKPAFYLQPGNLLVASQALDGSKNQCSMLLVLAADLEHDHVITLELGENYETIDEKGLEFTDPVSVQQYFPKTLNSQSIAGTNTRFSLGKQAMAAAIEKETITTRDNIKIYPHVDYQSLSLLEDSVYQGNWHVINFADVEEQFFTGDLSWDIAYQKATNGNGKIYRQFIGGGVLLDLEGEIKDFPRCQYQPSPYGRVFMASPNLSEYHPLHQKIILVLPVLKGSSVYRIAILNQPALSPTSTVQKAGFLHDNTNDDIVEEGVVPPIQHHPTELWALHPEHIGVKGVPLPCGLHFSSDTEEGTQLIHKIQSGASNYQPARLYKNSLIVPSVIFDFQREFEQLIPVNLENLAQLILHTKPENLYHTIQQQLSSTSAPRVRQKFCP